MLLLIAGITGNVGQYLAQSANKRGLGVRGLGRSPDKLDPSIKLESFVKSENYYDIPALEQAVNGVDAVVVAYTGIPELQVEGQLLLLRAAERAGVRIFHASSWNYDWTKMKLGEHESYDPYLAFHRTAQLSSSIKPLYLFTGVLSEVLFGVPGNATFEPSNHGIWDPKRKAIEYYGTGDEIYQLTTERDAAEFSIELILSEEGQSGKGGFYSACSSEHSLKEIAEIYGRVRGTDVEMIHKGSVEDLQKKALALRADIGLGNWWSYIGAFYQLFSVNGRWNLDHPIQTFPQVKRTGLEEFLRETPGA